MLRCAALLLAVLLLFGCEDEPRQVRLPDGTVDTFEDGDRTNAIDGPWQTIADGPGVQANVLVRPGSYEGGSFILTVTGLRTEAAPPSAVVGARTLLTRAAPDADPNQQRRTRDLSGFDGLAFALRGTPGTYVVQIGTAAVTDFDYYNAYVEADEDWTLFRVPFERFQQEGFGQPVPWTGQQVTHVAFYVPFPADFSFDLDDVRFYEDE